MAMAASPKLVVRVPEALHRAAKVKAFLLGQSLESVVVGLLESWVGSDKEAILDMANRLANGGNKPEAAAPEEKHASRPQKKHQDKSGSAA